MAAHSSILAWKIPWIEEPGRLPSMRSKRVGHDWATSLSLIQIINIANKAELPPDHALPQTWFLFQNMCYAIGNLLCPFPALADLPTLLSWRNLALSMWHFQGSWISVYFPIENAGLQKRLPLNCSAPKKVITRVLRKDLLMPVKALSQEARNLMSLLLCEQFLDL